MQENRSKFGGFVVFFGVFVFFFGGGGGGGWGWGERNLTGGRVRDTQSLSLERKSRTETTPL